MPHQPFTSSKVEALVEGEIVKGFTGINDTPIGDKSASSGAFTTLAVAGLATLADDLLIAGSVGFFGGAVQAKPTGVAVTEIAIHAALVTLNLIAGP